MVSSRRFSSAFDVESGYGIAPAMSRISGPQDFVFGSLPAPVPNINIPASLMDQSAALVGQGGRYGNVPVKTGFGSLDFTDKAGLALQGLSTIGGLYAAFQQLGLAKKQFNFQKQAWDTNLGNQIKSYNTALEDRARARAAMEGQSQEQANTYIEQNRMTR